MALVLKLHPGEDVFVGPTQVFLHSISGPDQAVLRVGNQHIEVNDDTWTALMPGCMVRLSKFSATESVVRVQFEAPHSKVLRGAAHRRPGPNPLATNFN